MILLIIFLFLLLVGPVGAGQVIGPIQAGPNVHPDNVGKCWEFTGQPEARQVPCIREQSNPCLAQMEQAMRAIEPFTILGHDTTVDDVRTGKTFWKVPIKPGAYDATVLWQTAKRDCWRTP